MIGMPAPGAKISMEQGGKAIAALAAIARKYPAEQARFDVTVTLNDEQWLAVMCAVGSIVTHAATDGAPTLFPEWVDERQREALEAIWEANMAGAYTAAMEVES